MKTLGLTGSIGMGKSTAARMLKSMGFPVHDADAVAHRLLANDRKIKAAIQARFPEAVENGVVLRQKLGARVFNNPEALRFLESLIHPAVRKAEQEFLRRARRQRKSLAVLDIPLLFETKAQNRADYVVVVDAPDFVQRSRVLSRPGMTEEKYRAILKRQIPNKHKRRKADFVIQTGLGKHYALLKLRSIVRALHR